MLNRNFDIIYHKYNFTNLCKNQPIEFEKLKNFHKNFEQIKNGKNNTTNTIFLLSHFRFHHFPYCDKKMTLSRLFTQHSWSLVRQLFWTSLVHVYEIFIVTRCVRESWLQNRAQEKREMMSNERKQSVNVTRVVKYDICKLRLMEEKFKMIIEDT